MKKFMMVALLALAGRGLAATSGADLSQYEADAGGDFATISSWFSQQVANGAGFLAGSHYGEPAAALKLGDFEAGGQFFLDASPVDVSGLRNLKLRGYATSLGVISSLA